MVPVLRWNRPIVVDAAADVAIAEEALVVAADVAAAAIAVAPAAHAGRTGFPACPFERSSDADCRGLPQRRREREGA